MYVIESVIESLSLFTRKSSKFTITLSSSFKIAKISSSSILNTLSSNSSLSRSSKYVSEYNMITLSLILYFLLFSTFGLKVTNSFGSTNKFAFVGISVELNFLSRISTARLYSNLLSGRAGSLVMLSFLLAAHNSHEFTKYFLLVLGFSTSLTKSISSRDSNVFRSPHNGQTPVSFPSPFAFSLT